MMPRRNRTGYGYKMYPDKYLYNELGLYREYCVSWMNAIRLARGTPLVARESHESENLMHGLMKWCWKHEISNCVH